MTKKIIRYISLLTPIVFLVSVVLNVWCVKDVVTDMGYTSQGWGLFNIPHDIIGTVGFKSAWLIIFGIFAIISLVLSIVLLTIIVLNSFKLTTIYRVEKILAISLGIVTTLGLLFGLFAIIANAHLGFMAGEFVETSKLIPMAGFYIYSIGGLVFSAFTILGCVLKDTTK